MLLRPPHKSSAAHKQSMQKHLGGQSTLKQGSTRILGHLGNGGAQVHSSMLKHLGGSSMLEQSEHGGAFARAQRAWLFLCLSILSISLCSA